MAKTAKDHTARTAAASHAPTRYPLRWRWLLSCVAAILVIGLAIYLNTKHDVDQITKVASTVDVDNGDLKINWDRYQTVNIELEESITISESGTYHLSGKLEDGNITIDAGIGEVRLILDNVSINHSSGPAIYCASAEDLVIETIGENYLSDGASYSVDYDEDVSGTIYSKADLTLGGTGSLDITGKYQDAVVGKDDIKINGGIYEIVASDDGIRGKDSVYIVSGNITASVGADAIKSTNEIDQGKGFILIENGTLTLSASAKGIKAPSSILIYGGDISLTTRDDSIHSNNYIGIIDGTFSIDSGDDGMHADRELIIDGGTIEVSQSYEGLEAQKVTINDGSISIKSSDDGINAGGGSNENSSSHPGNDAFNADENCILSINGGQVYVNASGDGVDSNGWLYFNGGETIVDGPTNNGNGALDSGLGIVMNGGTVIAIGSSGMAETLGENSNINNISIYLSASATAGTKISIKDSSGNTVLEHTAAKTFTNITAGTENFQIGETYTLCLNGKCQDFTLSSVTTTIGNSRENFNSGRQR